MNWKSGLFLLALLVSIVVARAEDIDNTEYNRIRIKEMLSARDVSFTPAERWAIFFNLSEDSYGSYDERELKYGIIEPLMKADDVDALAVFADAASSGSGIPGEGQNITRGRRLYEKAAELGDVESMRIVAFYCLNGSADETDERKAIKWLIQYDLFNPTVENREAVSKLYSGINPYTFHGTNFEPNIEKAEEWKNKAMELKNKQGPEPGTKSTRERTQQKQVLLTRGAGDMEEIMRRFWAGKFQEYMRKIEAGDVAAARNMAGFFETGRFSFRRDVVHAVEFYKKAADAGDIPSMSREGSLLIFADSRIKAPKVGLRLLYNAYRMEPNYYQRMRMIEDITKAFKTGPDEIRNEQLAEKWAERKKAESERVGKGGLPMVNKKWDGLTEADDYFRDKQ
jgi:TPR repeat protein